MQHEAPKRPIAYRPRRLCGLTCHELVREERVRKPTVFEYREERVRKPTNRFNYGTLGGTNPTPPPAEPKKKPKWHKEEIKDNGSSDSFLTGGFLPILRL